jgi:glycosyltransferase involved in cell wall biosynthesis
LETSAQIAFSGAGKSLRMMNSPKTLSLVIPCYNEEKTLAPCIKRVLAIGRNDLKLELIIVDDCSTDKSFAVAQDLAKHHPEITVLQHKTNRGKGAALRTGFARVKGEFVGIQDADLEYDPQDLHILLQPLIDDRADVVFGSRYLRPDSRRVLYFWHTWMNKTLTFVSNMFTNLDITDMETCYKLFRREIIQRIDLKEDRFGFEPEVSAKIAQIRCRVYECAISFTPRTAEEGKKINWKDGVRALYCIFHYSAPSAPLPLQLLLYLIIGALCAVVNVMTFSLLVHGGTKISIATPTAFLTSAALNYFLCIAILFRHKARWNTLGEIIAYLASILLMGLVDYGTTLGLIGAGMAPTLSKVAAATTGFIGNFLLRRFLVFPQPGVVRI